MSLIPSKSLRDVRRGFWSQFEPQRHLFLAQPGPNVFPTLPWSGGWIIQTAVELRFVPVGNRNAIWFAREAVPNLFGELEAFVG